MLLFSETLSSQFTGPEHRLIERCRTLAQVGLDQSIAILSRDELDQFVDAFNAMSRQLADSRAQAETAQQMLRQARDLLELRVAERTLDLMTVNERLLHELAERTRAEELLAQAARSDPLTGLMNRRAMLEHLEYEAARFQRSRTPFTLLLADLDRFKSINDTYGHDVGDQALIQASEQLTHDIRAHDLVARWGGEEFLILLPNTDLQGALVVAEALRQGVAVQKVVVGEQDLRLTLSIGVAVYGWGQTIHQCIKAADTALYQAKLEGRNRVAAAPAPVSFDADCPRHAIAPMPARAAVTLIGTRAHNGPV